MIGLCLLFILPTCAAFRGVRSFLSTQAVVVSILDEVTSEFLDRPLVIREIESIMNHHIDYFYIGCVTSSITYFIFQRLHWYTSFVKLQDLAVYRNSYINFRIFLLFCIILFMRDVENAI